MNSDGQRSELPTFSELDEIMKDRREAILTVFISQDGTTFDTSELRAHSGIPNGSTKFHLDKLVDWGLIEQLDKRAPPALANGDDAKLFRITERGREYAKDHIRHAEPDDLDELADRLIELEESLDALEEQHRAEMKDLKKQLHERLSSLKNALPSPSDNGVH